MTFTLWAEESHEVYQIISSLNNLKNCVCLCVCVLYITVRLYVRVGLVSIFLKPWNISNCQTDFTQFDICNESEHQMIPFLHHTKIINLIHHKINVRRRPSNIKFITLQTLWYFYNNDN